MNILVFNCGSSSLNYKLFSGGEAEGLRVIASGKAHRVGVRGSEPSFIEHRLGSEPVRQEVPIENHRQAAGLALAALRAAGLRPDAIGHRFVHGGDAFERSALLDEPTLQRLRTTLPLAPIHNPNSMSVIEVCLETLPGLPQYVTFDTAFHSGLPDWARTYSLPRGLASEHGLRKYGFHGLSYQHVTGAVARYLDRPLSSLKLIACHLGTGGSSAAAISGGQSLDTTMGYSPLAGLVMSTRTGDMDPLLPVYLMGQWGYQPDTLNDLFNKKSGLLGLSGVSSDIRDVIRAMDEGDHGNARLAFEMYTYRLRKTIGGYVTLLRGIDALIFTDDIGVQNARVRAAACRGLEWAGIRLDEAANQSASAGQIAEIGALGSAARVLTVPTDEERVIAEEGERLFTEDNP